MNTIYESLVSSDHTNDELLFSRIADDLYGKGYSVNPACLPTPLSDALYQHLGSMTGTLFTNAGVGRGDDYIKSEFIRTDEICWITGESHAGNIWLDWVARLQQYLNSRLFLGLFSFESHFAHYRVGDYYKRHVDAFKGEANRVLSLVVYLNPGWTAADGGEMVLYQHEQDDEGIQVTPLMGTLAVFLSEEFPHEVLPANRDRYSIAGWFRLNTSISGKIDPPN